MEFGCLKNKKAKKTSNSGNQMRRIEGNKSVVHIPQEIIENILTGLQLKSLIRFESVCKSWCSTITNPNFQRRDRHSILSVRKSSYAQFYHIISEQKEPFMEAFPVFWDNRERTKKSWYDPEDQYSRAHVSNSCNGLVLVCVGISFYLFNPSTHYFVKVLTLNYLDDDHKYYTQGSGNDEFCYILHIGLYYDETISDYKAVVLIRHPFLQFKNSGTVILVEASLKEKRWNHLNHTFKANDDITMGPIVKGRLHWLVNKKLTQFDPVLKVFEELPSFQPLPNHTKCSRISGIGFLEGHLCVARVVNENSVEILAMKEYGVPESWTPIFSLMGVTSSCNPLILTRTGELLVSIYDIIWVYDLGEDFFEEYRRLPNEGMSTCSVPFVPNMDTPTGYYWNQTEHENFGKTEDFERIDEFWKEIHQFGTID